MKSRLILISTILLIATTALFAKDPVKERKTIIIKDGKLLGDIEELRGKRAYLGLSLVEITNELREHYGATKEAGVIVGTVESGSPADKAGLRVGDVVVSVDGQDVDSSWDVRRAIAGKKEGDSVRIEYIRGRNRATTVASVVEREGLMMLGADYRELGRKLTDTFGGPEWRARVEGMQNCDELQTKLRELETRMKELEKKLQK